MRAIEFNTVIDDRHEIHITLPVEVRAGAARVIVLYDDNPETHLPTSHTFGQYRGQIQIAEDFDAPLPDSFWTGERLYNCCC